MKCLVKIMQIIKKYKKYIVRVSKLSDRLSSVFFTPDSSAALACLGNYSQKMNLNSSKTEWES